MLRRLLATALAALALPAAAQVAPAADYTDLWYVPGESGWGVSFTQHSGTGQVYAVWYTYDPRIPDPALAGRYKPLWIVMPGGTWTSPTSITGAVYVTDGAPFSQPGSNTRATRVGTFTFTFSGGSSASFSYQIAVPAGLASDDPAFGLPALSGAKSISRQSF
ncbi:MAG TPA: hypothetical protein VEG27_07650 [Usitatibacter sp.]|nr:hypothetical protein [Usitatibacter sp.]